MHIKLKTLFRILLISIYLINYSNILSAQELNPCNLGGKFGYKDSSGNIVIRARFDRALGFSEGLARVLQDGKWGYIDKTGTVVIPTQFDIAFSFENGLAKVEKNGQIGFVDITGHFYKEYSKAIAALAERQKQKTLSEASWSEYLKYNLGSKKDFFLSRGIYEKTENAIKEQVEAQIAIWQKKGEFETTQQWKERVTDQARNNQANEIAATLVEDYNVKLLAADAEYDKRYAQLVADYLKIVEDKFNSQKITLHPYDADNQTFLITTEKYGDILLPVPLSEAPDFKSNWTFIRRSVKPDFTIMGGELALNSVSFGKYVYDSNTEARYAQVEAELNFQPLNLSNIKFEFGEIEDKSSVVTVDKPVISSRKVTPDKPKIKIGNLVDVDINIPQSKKARESTFALIVANENYRRLSNVPFALNDGEVMRQYFNKTLGLPEKNILLAFDASGNDIKYNLDHISDICKTFGNDATLIVYYAGHGVPDNATKDAYLMPVDGYAERSEATGISLDGLFSRLQSLPTQRTILFIDACFGGTDRHDNMLAEARGVRIKPNANEVIANNFVVFTASQGDQTAHPYEEMNHGLFTYFLLKKLSESNGDVTLGDLVDYVTTQVKRKSVLDGKIQAPTVNVSRGNSGWRNWKL